MGKKLEVDFAKKLEEQKRKNEVDFNNELTALIDKYNCELIPVINIIGNSISPSLMIKSK